MCRTTDHGWSGARGPDETPLNLTRDEGCGPTWPRWIDQASRPMKIARMYIRPAAQPVNGLTA